MKKTDSNWKKELRKLFISGLRQGGVDSGCAYLVGVSGGMDSVFLTHFLKKCQVEFSIAHLNHNARKTATRDQEFVQKLTSKLDVEFYTDTINVPAYAKNENLSFEEAARISRYEFLMELSKQHKFEGVIVGHHADDQVETVLMHLLRGSGIAGLSGMNYREILPRFSKTIPVIRPMLGIWRDDIEQYCVEYGLDFVEDETNTDETFFRNRLRHHLLPLLENYNTGAKQHLWQTSMITKQTLSTLDFVKMKNWHAVLVTQEHGVILWDRTEFESLESGLKNILLRYALQQLLPEMRDFGYKLTKKTMSYLNNPPEGGQWQVIGDVYSYVHGELIYIGFRDAISSLMQKDYPQWDQTPIKVNSLSEAAFPLNNGLELKAKKIQAKVAKGSPWLSSKKTEAWLDADKIQWPLVIRSYCKGDRFEPFGMAGENIKVSDYFINQKIPQPVRQKYPLIIDQGGVLWIVGERIADRIKITAETTNFIHLQLMKEESD